MAGETTAKRSTTAAKRTTAKRTTAKRTTAKRTTAKSSGRFTSDERDAMKERARELKAEQRRGQDRAAGEADLRAKIGEMSGTDRAMAERLHAIVTGTAPDLMPKTWYGMPAYADASGAIVCFFQPAAKFRARYATFGFNEAAKLDQGAMWPTSWALTSLSAAEEKKIVALVKKAAR